MDLGKLLVISPHLDDAVFGCGELLASHPGAVVVTVFAGIPAQSWWAPEWDTACGFASAREAVSVRRREDREALEILDAQPCWLNCLDAQYRHRKPPQGVGLKLARALRRHDADTIAIPLGLFHEDHKIAHEAALGLLRPSQGKRWIVYGDALYRRIPGLMQERLSLVERAGASLEALPGRPAPGPQVQKSRAVRCYASQLRGLSSAGRPGHADVLAPETYWRLSA
jgi:LmbE family N-acetylglucosaminyl deacetylase